MTSNEFVIWLRGFLDASDDLTVEGVEFIKSKMKDINDFPLIQPINIPYQSLGDCPAGGWHEYPDMWHGTIPPPCKKCGQQSNQLTVTYCNSPSAVVVTEVQDLRDGSKTMLNYEIPVEKDGTFTFQIPQDSVLKSWEFRDGVHKANMTIPVQENNPATGTAPPTWEEAKNKAISDGTTVLFKKLVEEYNKVPLMPITTTEGQQSYVEKMKRLIIDAEENAKRRKAMETNFSLHNGDRNIAKVINIKDLPKANPLLKPPA